MIRLLLPLLLFLCACDSESKVESHSELADESSPRLDSIHVEAEQIRDGFIWPEIISDNFTPTIQRIQHTLSFENVTGSTFPELDSMNKSCGNCGLISTGFMVNYNQNGILDIIIQLEHNYNEPAISDIFFCLNLNTGNQLSADDMLISEQTEGLLHVCDSLLQAELVSIKKEYALSEEFDEIYIEFFDGHRFTKKDLEHFSISHQGIHYMYHTETIPMLERWLKRITVTIPWKTFKVYTPADGPFAFLFHESKPMQ